MGDVGTLLLSIENGSLQLVHAVVAAIAALAHEVHILPLLDPVGLMLLHTQPQLVELLLDVQLVPVDPSLVLHLLLELAVSLKVDLVYRSLLKHFGGELLK